MDELQGRVAVITGGASGIGLAMAERFAADGMKIVLGDVEQSALDAAVDSLTTSGAEVVGALVDVTDPVQMTALADAARDAFGGWHVVCLNAGVGAGGLTWEVDRASWKWVLDVNMWGIINGIEVFVPELVQQKVGHVVITASLAGLVYGPMMAPYNASKAAAVAIGETLSAELMAEAPGVGVSILCPAWVNTRIMDSARNRPGGRVDEVDEAAQAEAAAFFASSMPASQVADAVSDAVQQNRLHILTHDFTEQAIRARVAHILGEI